jgi:hypothetical protein
MADPKPYVPLAQRQLQYQAEIADAGTRIKQMIVGAAKGVTTDLPGLVLDFVDKLANDPGPKDGRSSQIFEKLTGIQSTGSTQEQLGGMINPGTAAKAMIVGAFTAVKAGKVSKAHALTSVDLANDLESRAFQYNAGGAFRDKDGMLKATLSDAKAILNEAGYTRAMEGNSIVRLDEVLKHEELYNLYPDLAGLKVEAALPGYGGRYIPSLGIIEVQKGLEKDPDRIRSVLLHELQHSVQETEGFGRGGTSARFRKYSQDVETKLEAKTQSRDPATRDAASRLLEKINDDKLQAYHKYSELPGEKEARFTEATRNLSEEQLAKYVQKLLNTGVTPQSYIGHEPPNGLLIKSLTTP